ncbi:MAG TPA: hypothetical protein VGB53_13510 [Rubricoccaceae bacterium]
MTPLAALAAAVRDRLLAGADAPLPGIGTLARAHVSARIATGPGGERMLMPPGEAVRLLGRTSDPTDLAQALARHLGGPPEAAAAAFRDAVDQLDARLAVTGDARLEGIGVFQRTSSGVRFAAAPEILAAVNRAYEGLVPVAVAPAPAPPPAPPVAPLAPLPPLPDEPPGAVDILLDLIVNEPAETQAPPRAAADETPEPHVQAGAPVPTSPAESTFTDEPEATPLGTTEPVTGPPDTPPVAAPVADIALPADTSSPSAAPEIAHPVEATTGEADSDVATPFESGETLRDPVSPDVSAADWHPAPLVDLAADEARPLDRLDDIEDAEVLDASPSPTPAAFDALSVATDPLPEPPPLVEPPDAAAELADVPADEPHAPPLRREVPDPAAPGRPERRAWAFLYAAVVLGLSALVLYWFIDERRPLSETIVAPTVEPQTAAAPLPAADSLAAFPDTSAPASVRLP